MPNPIKGEVQLKLEDGREFTLVFDMEALVEAEGAYAKPLQQLLADAKEGFVGAVRAMLYGALRAKHPPITLRDASAMLQTDGEAVSAALEQAMDVGMPDAGEKPAEGKDGANPPGKISGASGAKPGSTRKRSGARRPAPSR